MDEQIYKSRREDFLVQMKKSSVALLFSATQKTRSNDTEYPYRQDSDFYYLTGFKEDNAVLVLVKGEKSVKEILFVQKKEKALELWTGKRLGCEGAKERFDVDKIYTSESFEEKLKKILIDLFLARKMAKPKKKLLMN